MALPFTYPKTSGPGRLTEICSFRRSKVSQDEFETAYNSIMSSMAEFPISRKSILANQIEDPDIRVLIADWTSAEEKDVFEPGERYQGLKPSFGVLMNNENPSFACHHLILPGPAETPSCDFYTVSHMTIPVEKQGEAASAFQDYVANHKPHDLVFLAVAPSREDAGVVVVLSGHQQEKSATIGIQTPEHEAVKERLNQVVSSGSKYAARLASAKSM